MKARCRLGVLMMLLLSGTAWAQSPPERGEGDAPEAAAPASFWEGWTGSADLGLNGSAGNASSLNLRASLGLERKLELEHTTLSFTYSRASADEEVTANRAEVAARQDWLFADAPRWRYFLTGRYEYDDFQDWQHRVTVGNGLGYSLVKTDATELVGRFGVGAFREIGGSDNRIHPEGIVGLDLTTKLTERQKLTFTAEYLPDLLDFPGYKARAAAGWEILVDPQSQLVLKLGAEDRYDSTPGEDKHRNDVDYFLTLGVKF
jgi:putative salt-induced outer membrane protein YdiY